MNDSDVTQSHSTPQESDSSQAKYDAMHGADLFLELSAHMASLSSMEEARRGGPVQPGVVFDSDRFWDTFNLIQRQMTAYRARMASN